MIAGKRPGLAGIGELANDPAAAMSAAHAASRASSPSPDRVPSPLAKSVAQMQT